MPASTSPDNIPYPISTDAFGPLESVFAAMATGLQTALNNKGTYRTADLASLITLTGMTTGSLATVIEGGATFEWNGTIWVQKTRASFTSTSTRDAAYAKASAQFLVTGVAIATVGAQDCVWNGTVWVNSAIRMSGAPSNGVVASGAAFTNITTPMIQGGTAVISLNGSSSGTISFDQPFPNGVLTVIPVNGDASARGSSNLSVNGVTLSNFTVVAYTAGALAGGGAYRVNWLAIGW